MDDLSLTETNNLKKEKEIDYIYGLVLNYASSCLLTEVYTICLEK